MSKRKRRKFTAEQKAEAVRLVEQVGNLSQVARNLDLHPNVLRNWVKQAEVDAGRGPKDALTTDEKQVLQDLLRENKRLRMERDFLKKPQPSAPGRKPRSLRADRGGEGQLPSSRHVQAPGRLAERVLCMAQEAALAPRDREPTAPA